MNKKPKNMNSCVRETYRKSYNWEHMLGNILLIWYLILLVHIRHMIGRHCVKVVRIRSYSGPYFLRIGLNTERYSVSLRIQSECGKIPSRITSNKDTFYTANNYKKELLTLAFVLCSINIQKLTCNEKSLSVNTICRRG